jgi:hypothetical protein
MKRALGIFFAQRRKQDTAGVARRFASRIRAAKREKATRAAPARSAPAKREEPMPAWTACGARPPA